MKKKVWFIVAGLLLLGCGEDPAGINVTEVLGIPAGDKEGTALTGVFSTRVKYTGNGCRDFPALEVPQQDLTKVLNVSVEHTEGVLILRDIEQPLFGGVYFDNRFEVGSTATLDRMGDQNILRAMQVKGRFIDPNTFEGNGLARMIGRIEAKNIDCTYSFTVSGIRS